MYFEAILKNIYKNKFKNILNIFEIVVSLLTIIILIGMISNIKYKIDCVKEIASLDTIKGSVTVQALDENENYTDYRYNKVPNYLNEIFKEQENKDDIIIGRYQLATLLTDLENINMIKIDKNFINIIDFKMYEGRMLEKNDFENINSSTPIIVSYDMKDKYPINSKFTVQNYPSRDLITYEVIGVLDENNKLWTSDKVLVDYIDNQIIVPTDKFDEEYTYLAKSTNKSNGIDEKVKLSSEVEQFNSNEFKITHKNDTLKNLLDEKLKKDSLKIFFLGMFSIVLLVLVLIGIRSLFALQVIERKKEFGVHYSLGGTTKGIFIMVIGEILIDILISIIFALGIFKIMYKYMLIENSIRITNFTFIYSIMIVLLIVFFSIIFTLNKLFKTNPIELIRSNLE